MMRASIWCAAAMLLLGCESGEEPVRGIRTVADTRPHTRVEQPPREPAETPRPEAFSVDLVDISGQTTEDAERDLSAELNAAIGTPSDCVRDFTAPRPTKIRVSVSATVRPTGMVITPSAYASGISTAARLCIERRVGSVVLAALEEPVSQSVSTVVEIDYEPEVIVEADPGVPEPDLKNVRAPLPKYPMIPLDAKFIDGWPTSNWISGGFDGGIPMQKDTSKRIRGPKPVPIDGYEVFENAQIWTDKNGDK
ncbi:MAG: hypothetical protein WBM48_18525 [Polyangiales bacterium]|jgi:hypothetical protein